MGKKIYGVSCDNTDGAERTDKGEFEYEYSGKGACQ
jgi:hypothetical protein